VGEADLRHQRRLWGLLGARPQDGPSLQRGGRSSASAWCPIKTLKRSIGCSGRTLPGFARRE
jgi:hypothetical protein